MTRPASILVSAAGILACAGIPAWIAGCTGGTENAPLVPDNATSLLTANPGDRAVVAEVNGVPVYDDCVAIQSAASGIDRHAALAQCIDFELLAQAAQKRGHARNPDVARTRKTEAVRRLLDVEIREPLPDAGENGQIRLDRAVLEDAYKRFRRRIYRPEIRHLAHVLAPLDKDEPQGSSADRAARALADKIYTALAQRRDLDTDEFFARAQDIARQNNARLGPVNKKTGAFKPETFKLYPDYPNIHPAFTAATFEVAGAGMVSPPVRTHVGWHVILVTVVEPERNATAEQAAGVLVPLLRRERYRRLVDALQKNVVVTIDEDALARLQAAEDALRFAPSEPPPGAAHESP